MVVFVGLWPYLLTTKLSCLAEKNFEHTNVGSARVQDLNKG